LTISYENHFKFNIPKQADLSHLLIDAILLADGSILPIAGKQLWYKSGLQA